MSIKDTLAQFAVKNTSTRSPSTPVYELSVEAAREYVVVINGAKDKSEHAQRQLTLRLSRRKLALDPIAPKADFIGATEEQEPEFTEALLKLVADGEFDAQIAETQALLRETAEAPKEPKAEAVADTAGVDLDALDA